MKPALMILALLSPLIFFNRIAKSYLLSLSQETQGGRLYLWQKRQKLMMPSFVMPMVMSVLANIHASHTLDSFG